MNEIKTQGNFMSYGSQEERRAAFALESDRRLFETARDLLSALIRLEDASVEFALQYTPYETPQTKQFLEALNQARAIIAEAKEETK